MTFTNYLIVWDAFKPFNCRVLTSHNNFKDKTHRQARNELLSRIEQLENTHKINASPENLVGLTEDVSQVKIPGAHIIAKDIMFSRQRIFQFRDKPAENLVRLLPDPSSNTIGLKTLRIDGKLTSN